MTSEHVKQGPRADTHTLAIVPALIGIFVFGEGAVTRLLVLTQVVLSLQLPFAIYPLIRATSDKRTMGEQVTRPWVAAIAWGLFAAITGANGGGHARHLARSATGHWP